MKIENQIASRYLENIKGIIGMVEYHKRDFNLKLDDLSISDELKSELRKWMLAYDRWIDWDEDKIVPNGIELEAEHNQQGEKLTEKVKKETD